jgi:hypothetical protein
LRERDNGNTELRHGAFSEYQDKRPTSDEAKAKEGEVMTYTTADLLDMGQEEISNMSHGDLCEALIQLQRYCKDAEEKELEESDEI